MEPNFNINRKKLSDEEIESGKDFDALVKKFKENSIKDAKARKQFPKIRKLVYTTVIAGFLVVCTVSINELTKNKSNDNTTTSLVNKKQVLTDKASANYIKPIKKESNLAYSKYKVNAKSGGVITHKTKSQITVPKSAFVKKDGKEVTGDVEIHYREMHDVADQLISGIPMVYDSAGSKYHFESAGMLEIKGYQGSEEVFIRPGKQLDVNMVSKKDGDRFNVYKLDTTGKKWDNLGKDEIVSLDKFKDENSSHTYATEVKETKEIKVINSKIETLDEKKVDVIVSTDKKIELLPKPQEPSKPAIANKERKQFILDVNFNQFPELKAFDGCVFEVGEENKHYTKEFSSITWADAYITPGTIKGKNYTLNLELKQRKEKLIVYPVFTGDKLVDAQKIYSAKFNEYQSALTDRKDKEKKLKEEMEKEIANIEAERKEWLAKLEAERKKQTANIMQDIYTAKECKDMDFKVRRLFQINSFGVFNTDCAQKLPNAVATNAVFTTKDAILQPSMAYLVDVKANMLFTYTLKDLENFKYENKTEYKIITSVNNNLYICDHTAFNNAQKDGDKTVFSFEPIIMDLVDAEELRKKLGV